MHGSGVRSQGSILTLCTGCMSEKEVQLLRKELRLLQDQVASLQLRVSELEDYEVISYPGGYQTTAAPDSGELSSSARPAAASSTTSSSATPVAPSAAEADGDQSWEFFAWRWPRRLVPF